MCKLGQNLDLWARLLAVDETSHEYFAERSDWPGAIVFTNPQAAPFNLALLQQAAPAQADALLDSIIGHYRSQGIAPRVRVTPLSRPADWPQRLAQRGFTPAEEEDELFLLLDGDLATPADPAVQIRRVPAGVSPEVFARTQQAGFGVPEEEAARGIALTERAVLAGRYRFYVACLQDRPVGAASARLSGGVAGLYGVTTLPDYRRRGVSTALIHHIVGEASAEGHPLIFLSAEPHGYAAHLYERLGFRPLFAVQNFALAPLT